MTSEPVSVRLLDRLRAEGVVPMMADCRLERLYPSKQARRRGGWSWRVCWGIAGIDGLPHRAGSQFPMKLCVQADRWEVNSGWVSTEGCTGQFISPMNDEDIRSR